MLLEKWRDELQGKPEQWFSRDNISGIFKGMGRRESLC